MIPATLNSVRWDEVNQIKYRFQALQFNSDGRFHNSSCCRVITVAVTNFKRCAREKCPYSVLFWSAFPHIQIEYGEILRISPYSARMLENADQITPNTNTFYAVFTVTEKYHLFKVNNRNTRNTGIVLMSLLLTLGIFNSFF